MNAVEVTGLGKRYFRRRDTHRSFKSYVLSRIRLRRQTFDPFWAVRDVNFQVRQGETLGIIGANGAGKSTLLSLIANTTAPTEGEVRVHGRVSSLLELGAGFHPDLSGRENVFLNASILGMRHRDTLKRYDEIVDLAGIEDAMDTPVKFYSSGMYVRLAFAVAVMCDPDILLMDEVLAVGDESFRKKSMERIERFRSGGKTLLIVSHDLEAIKRLSDRVLFLNQGTVSELGGALEVVDHYRNYTIFQDGNVTVKEFGTEEIRIESVAITVNGEPLKESLPGGAAVTIALDLVSLQPIQDPVVGFGLTDNLGQVVFGTNTQIQGVLIDSVDGTRRITIEIPRLHLQRGVFYLSLAVHNQDHTVQYHRLDNVYKLKITSKERAEGFLAQPCRICVQ